MKRQNKENKPVKQEKPKKQKKSYTYAEAHNRAFWAFNKSSRIMVWAAVFNVIGLMIAIVQANFGTHANPDFFRQGTFFYGNIVRSSYEYSLCYGICGLIFRFLEMPPYGEVGSRYFPLFAFIIIAVVVAIAISAITVIISIQASQGKKWALFTQTGFYLIDTAAIIPLYLLGEYPTVLWIMIGLHVLILVFLGVSIYQYYHIIEIEKIYKNSLTNKAKANGGMIKKTKKNINMMVPNREQTPIQPEIKKENESNGTRNNKK